MVKLRMSTADVAAEVKCLRRLIGMRCSNVYDLSPKTYLFKLMNSSGITESGESEKVLLLMESGARLHTTEYVRDKNATPSGFTLKIRKHIRTKRLEDVRQLGYDRIVLFQFGMGESANYVILELYAQGNILLTDSEFVVLTLLRSHRDDNKGLAIMSRHLYPLDACRVFERTDTTNLVDLLRRLSTANVQQGSEPTVDGANASVNDNSKETSDNKKPKKRGQNKKVGEGTSSNKLTLKTVLGEALTYGPSIAEHIILDAGLVPSTKVWDDDTDITEETVEALTYAIIRFEDWLVDVMSGEKIPKGYIFMKNKSTGKKDAVLSADSSVPKLYEEYCPILLSQYISRDYDEFESFDAAVDEFYSKFESHRLEEHQKAKEDSAMQKLNKIRLDQESRVHALRKEVYYSVRMAELIEYNLEDVDAAIQAVRVALANGMSWDDLGRMIKEERKAGNPIAGLIDKLHLEKNCITLLLSKNLDEMDEDEKTDPVEKVEVDLALSAHANARRWYDMKKKQETKQEKTISAHEKAFKAAEKKTRLQLTQEKTVAAITHVRKVHWFEKFNWFISSENYLIISGRDAQQNELLVKRYMSKTDLYVHADLHGASSTVIKNHRPDDPIPPLTLNQAGCFTVCQSQAWNSKIVTSAWWVYPHQVSKTAPTGEYLTVGSFMIRGKKNFLPPHPLVMGFGILFRLEESSLSAHLNERKVRGEDESANELESRLSSRPGDSELDEELVVSDEDINEPEQPLGSGSGVAPPNSISLKSLEIKGTDKYELSASSQLDELIDKALGVGPAKVSAGSKPVDVSHGKIIAAESSSNDNGSNALREKPYISKAERRKMKKGQNTDEFSSDSQTKKEGSESSTSLEDKIKVTKKPANPKVSRGQKSKLKKIKEKYAEQDEEEREIRMALLASAGNALEKEKPEPDIDDSKQKKSVAVVQDDSLKICYKCKKPGHLSRFCQEYPAEDASLLMNSTNGSNLKNLDDQHAEPHENGSLVDSSAIEEDGTQEFGEEKEKLNDVDYLTGNPLPSDILLYAVPVCGPYNAVQSYKYRVKITPGSLKRGKAVKTALNHFLHLPELTNREKELLKACTDPELVAAIVSNVKITAPGLAQLKQKQKKGKKSAAKES